MHNTFPIIALGASAGGLEPLEEFFGKICNNTYYTSVIKQLAFFVLHLPKKINNHII